ncbi:MAG TPA: mRNA surveillance protein pelota, partial [Thermoplasmatales archaeon]|nr:mRNA surveillance protein pelota [Thermoplasmatales archaeon]
RAVTFRSTEQKKYLIRSKKTEKKKMRLGIRVEDVKFHEFSDRLRVHGVIEEGPQDLGSYHTLNITSEENEPITIIKEEWTDYELNRLEEAVRQRRQTIIIFVSLDDETATIALLRQSGVQWITDIHSHQSGKMYETQSTEKEYFEEIINLIQQYKKEETPIVVIGPGFTREQFVKYGKEKKPDLFHNTVTYGTGHAGMNGIQEALKSGVVEHIARENRVVFETKLIEQLFEEIKKNGLVGYGEREVETLLESGAVKHLLITEKLLREENGEKLLRLAQRYNADFTVVSISHDAGRKLDGLGGVAAFLRFKLENY